jgi:exosortase
MEKQPTDGILEEFRIEFLECWRRLPNKGFFFILLAAWLALFQFLGNSTLGYIHTTSLLRWMYNAYNPNIENPITDDGHGLLVPFIVAGLFWWKRKQLTALPLDAWWPSLIVVGCGLMLHLAGYALQEARISIVGLFTGIYGLTGLAWGLAWLRASFFPFVLFVFCVPFGSLAEPVTFPLRLLVSRLVELVSHYVLAIEVQRVGTQLFAPPDAANPGGQYQYEVAPACSGMRSLIATLAMALIYGVLCFPRWWKRAVLVVSAFPLAVFGNLIRMLTIIIAAEIGGQKAGNYVHDGGPGGILKLLPYIPAFFGLLLLGHWLGEAPVGRVLPPNEGAARGEPASATVSPAESEEVRA